MFHPGGAPLNLYITVRGIDIMTQILDGDELRWLAKKAQKEGMSRTKFATLVGIHPRAAGYLYD